MGFQADALQEQKNIRAEKELLHKTTHELIKISMRETPEGSKLTDRIVTTVELRFLGLVMKVVQNFWMWCRRHISELNLF